MQSPVRKPLLATVVASVLAAAIVYLRTTTDSGFHPFLSTAQSEIIAVIVLKHHLSAAPGHDIANNAKEIMISVLGRSPTPTVLRQLPQVSPLVIAPTVNEGVARCSAERLNSILPRTATLYVNCWAGPLISHKKKYWLRNDGGTWLIVDEKWISVS